MNVTRSEGHRRPAGKRSNTQIHIHRYMVSKTISLEKSAYARLKAAKRPGESFSDVVHRVLGGEQQPSLLEFTRLLPKKDAERVAEVVARLRAEDIEVQKKRFPLGRRSR